MGGGGDRIIPTAVFIVTFVAMSAFIIAGFNEMLTKAEQNSESPLPPSPATQLAFDLDLELYDPGTQFTNGTTLHGTNRHQSFSFTKTGQTDVGVAVFRNVTSDYFWNVANGITSFSETGLKMVLQRINHNTPHFKPQDFVVFWQSWMGGTLALERRIRYQVETFPEIAKDHEPDTNFTVIQSHLRYWTTDIIGWERHVNLGATSQDYLLWANQFNISVATGFNATYGSISASTVMGQLLGMKLPNVPFFIQAMIAIPCYLAIILVCALVVSYFIP
jgi:hypothetical protein